MRVQLRTLQKYLEKLRQKHYPNVKSQITVSDRLPSRFGGMAYNYGVMGIAKWILSDKEEAFSTVRHEFAHHVVQQLLPNYKIHHGKEFHSVLRKIAPKTWREDCYWHYTPAITAAREKIFKPSKRRKAKWHEYVCISPNCTYVYKYARIPWYVKEGIARCPRCNSKIAKGGK